MGRVRVGWLSVCDWSWSGMFLLSDSVMSSSASLSTCVVTNEARLRLGLPSRRSSVRMKSAAAVAVMDDAGISCLGMSWLRSA